MSFASDEVPRRDRRRDRGPVAPRPLERAEHRPHRLVRRDLHRGHREQRGRDEVDVRHALDPARVRVHEAPDAESHRRDVEQRVQEARDDRAAPGPQPERPVVPKRAPPRRTSRRAAGRAPRAVSASRRSPSQSTSVRPVSRKNTSSSVERRTSALSGVRPARVDRTSASSPSSTYRSSRSGSSSTRSARSATRRDVGAVRAVQPEPQLEDLARRVLRDQLARRAVRDDLAAVHHDEPVAELLGLVHVVRRDHERHALGLQPVEPLPDEVARLRVEARRRLVEDQHVGLGDQRPRDREPALHAPREVVRLVVRRARSSWVNSRSDVRRGA